MTKTDGRSGGARTPAKGAGTTSASRVYASLRRDIVFGDYRPGARLTIEALCSRYGAGSIPTREALNRLAAEKLIRQEDQRGFSVPLISAAELEELTATRCWINDILVRETIANATPEWEEQLVLAAHWFFRTQRSRTGEAGINSDWEQRHRAFHMALVAGCRSRWLQEFHADLFDYADFYRHQYVSAERGQHRRDVDQEHRDLFDAALRRDARDLTARLNEHVWLTTRILVAALAKPGDVVG